MTETWKIVTPWVNGAEIDAFLDAWRVTGDEDWLVLHHDTRANGSCGQPKNEGVAEAVRQGADIVVILDGDCYPDPEGAQSLVKLAEWHVSSLQPQRVESYLSVTSPPSRGTPYVNTGLFRPVAASMGFWTEIGDYCAVRQLAHRSAPMTFRREPIFGSYFPLCGMNLAFRPNDWNPWCQFIDVPRFDDIWMGWLWQREAYRRGYCFNLAGPMIRHARQSNVWKNLRAEVRYLEETDTLWSEIALHDSDEYDDLRGLLPC